MENLIENGFAVAVAGFLLLRVEKQVKRLADAISLLRHCQICRVSPWRLKPAEPSDEDDDIIEAEYTENNDEDGGNF